MLNAANMTTIVFVLAVIPITYIYLLTNIVLKLKLNLETNDWMRYTENKQHENKMKNKVRKKYCKIYYCYFSLFTFICSLLLFLLLFLLLLLWYCFCCYCCNVTDASTSVSFLSILLLLFTTVVEHKNLELLIHLNIKKYVHIEANTMKVIINVQKQQ